MISSQNYGFDSFLEYTIIGMVSHTCVYVHAYILTWIHGLVELLMGSKTTNSFLKHTIIGEIIYTCIYIWTYLFSWTYRIVHEFKKNKFQVI